MLSRRDLTPAQNARKMWAVGAASGKSLRGWSDWWSNEDSNQDPTVLSTTRDGIGARSWPRSCGNGGLSTPTAPMPSAAVPGKTARSRASTRVFAMTTAKIFHSLREAQTVHRESAASLQLYQAARA